MPEIALNLKQRVNPLENAHQNEIWNSKDFLKERQNVFNFLLKVSKRLQLTSKNLFKTFQLFDLYITLSNSEQPNYFKIGIVCLFIMTKYEDGKILSHSIFTEIFNGNLTKEEYHQIESNILQMVEFKINLETVLDAHSLLETAYQIN